MSYLNRLLLARRWVACVLNRRIKGAYFESILRDRLLTLGATVIMSGDNMNVPHGGDGILTESGKRQETDYQDDSLGSQVNGKSEVIVWAELEAAALWHELSEEKIVNGPRVFDEPIPIEMSKVEVETLVANSEFFRAKLTFEGREPEQMTLELETPPEWAQGVCVYLLVLNARSDVKLPNLNQVGIRTLVQVCTYFGYDKMLAELVKYALGPGFKYAFEILHELIMIVGRSASYSQELLDAMVQKYFVFKYEWFQSGKLTIPTRQFDLLCNNVQAIARNKTKRAEVTKAMIRSPSVRTFGPMVPLCPHCCDLVDPSSGGMVTPCCQEPCHASCWVEGECPICMFDTKQMPILQSRFSRQAIPLFKTATMTCLRDIKFFNWVDCCLHSDCKMFVCYRSPMAFHHSASEITQIAQLGPPAILQFHDRIRMLLLPYSDEGLSFEVVFASQANLSPPAQVHLGNVELDPRRLNMEEIEESDDEDYVWNPLNLPLVL